MSADRITVRAECCCCKATGVYRMSAHEGIGTVCKICHGTGCVEEWYVPFTERQRRTDVRTVATQFPPVFPGMSPPTTSVTYDEFLSGKMP